MCIIIDIGYINTTRNVAYCKGIMPGARTPGKFARSNVRDGPGKMS